MLDVNCIIQVALKYKLQHIIDDKKATYILENNRVII